MGGVKNRDEKRKKAHVYSSGGGGGTRGPAVLDKRNQELQCPHCERIFKQPGRLQDHVKKQHAGEAEPDGSDSSQATETTSLQGNREAGSSSAGAAQRMIKHALGGQPTCDGSRPLQPDSAAPGTAGAAASAPPKLMEVGSKGGYYSGKSPKLLLHELCLKEKVKPRYKAVEAGPGLWRCKVVLPHPKNSDKDVVVFLDDAHAATCQEEAAQRAAVAALSRVAGDRALERLLPRDYVPLWHALGKQRAQREERRQREAERSRAAAARQKAVSRRRGPATVYMTEDKRRLVEGLISGAPLEGGGRQTEGEGGIDWEGAVGEGDVSQHSGGGDGDAGCSGDSALLEELLLLGFSEGQAARAVAACGGSGGSGGTLPDALDWLCLHLPEDELPANFGPGAAGKPVTVLRRGTSTDSLAPSASAGTLSEADVAAATSDPAVVELLQYGYPLGRCTAALKGSGGDVAAALALLFRQLAGDAEVASGSANDSSGVDLAEWEEERMALDAIYDEAITFHSPIWTTLRLTVPGCTAASGLPWQAVQPTASGGTPQEDAVLYLECWAPMGGAYPHSLPTLAARCPDAPPLSLLALTHQLALKALELRGHPMLFELASTAAELLPLCLGDPPPLPPGWDLAAVVSAAPAAATATLQAGEGRPGCGVDVMEGDARSDAQHAAQRHGVHSREEPRRDGYQRRQVQQQRRQVQQQRQRGGKEGAGARQLQAQLDLVAESRRLREHQEQMEREPAHAAMRAVRAKLPAAGLRDVVVGLVEGRRVVVVSGATGCGKSTQVPQFVLEAAIAQGEGAQCGIICTQPRRISAVGLATRVAAERGERVGEVVGYSVRLDSRQSRRTRLLFCTTGILLRRLLSDPSLSGTTHVVLDEVHERSIESDLLLLLLRNLLEAGVNPGLRVVLMSATADAELFAGYFSSKLGEPSGMVTIPGFTHPVTDHFLEDALESTGFEVGRTSKWAKKAAGGGVGKSGGGGAGAPPPKKSGSKGCAAEEQLYGGYSESTRQSLQNVDEAQVNYDLVDALVARVVEERQAQQAQRGAAAAILIFAPGAEEISKICRGLQGSPRVGRAAGGGGVWVLPLHGGLPPAQQAKVFERPPKGSIKVVVATNVAETSITIDDVTCVIDCGRVKEMRFDPDRGIARLQETWVSQASALQRRGRAGRVQPGVCYRLFSSSTWGKMQKDTPPEVLRAPLQGLVLDVKGILGADVDAGEVLGQMITPPAPAALKQALGSLGQIGALDASLPSLRLTPLGQHLTRMPCDPRIGKMLVFGALLRCLDPILTIAAAQGHGRPAFFSPPDKRDEADAAKRTLTAHVAGSKSDHLAVVAAYNGWVTAVEAGGKGGGQDFCARNFIADQAMEGIKAGRQQYADILADLGFVPAGYGRAGERAGALHLPAAHDVDQYSSNARVVKAALCAGFYPQVLRVDHPAAKFSKVQGGAMETDADPSKLKFFDRHKGRVFLHPSSLNFTCGKFESGWVVYSEVVQTSKVFVRESSMVPVYALLLFGGPISVSHEEGLVRVDGWATFKAPARIAVLVRELRQQCGTLLAAKIANPELDVSRSRVVEAMHHLLASDGF